MILSLTILHTSYSHIILLYIERWIVRSTWLWRSKFENSRGSKWSIYDVIRKWGYFGFQAIFLFFLFGSIKYTVALEKYWYFDALLVSRKTRIRNRRWSKFPRFEKVHWRTKCSQSSYICSSIASFFYQFFLFCLPLIVKEHRFPIYVKVLTVISFYSIFITIKSEIYRVGEVTPFQKSAITYEM